MLTILERSVLLNQEGLAGQVDLADPLHLVHLLRAGQVDRQRHRTHLIQACLVVLLNRRHRCLEDL